MFASTLPEIRQVTSMGEINPFRGPIRHIPQQIISFYDYTSFFTTLSLLCGYYRYEIIELLDSY